MKLQELGKQAAEKIKGRTALIVTDRNVAPLYLAPCRASLEAAGFAVFSYITEPGEISKSGSVYLDLLNFMASIPMTRTDCAVALGGGVMGDLTGFAAATYLRGIPVIQVPTSLLAMVDSSVGGKTAINLPAGKNLAGAFHLPSLVLWDMDFLQTLPEAYWVDGLGEVIKYGVLCDPDLFCRLRDPSWARTHPDELVARCVEIKEHYVSADLYDRGLRQHLNLGHTIGHTIELYTDFQISHGRAVAMGIAKIAEISAGRGWCSRSTADEICSLLKLYGFSLDIPAPMEELARIMLTDKKRKGDVIDFVIPTKIGSCTLKKIPVTELKELLCGK